MSINWLRTSFQIRTKIDIPIKTIVQESEVSREEKLPLPKKDVQSSNLQLASTTMIGTPLSLASKRAIIISQPARSAMQSGRRGNAVSGSPWIITFSLPNGSTTAAISSIPSLPGADDGAGQPRKWINTPMLSWTSSDDPVGALKLQFSTLQDAIRYADRMGWQYSIHEPKQPAWRTKSYADNFTFSSGPLRIIRTK